MNTFRSILPMTMKRWNVNPQLSEHGQYRIRSPVVKPKLFVNFLPEIKMLVSVVEIFA